MNEKLTIQDKIDLLKWLSQVATTVASLPEGSPMRQSMELLASDIIQETLGVDTIELTKEQKENGFWYQVPGKGL